MRVAAVGISRTNIIPFYYYIFFPNYVFQAPREMLNIRLKFYIAYFKFYSDKRPFRP